MLRQAVTEAEQRALGRLVRRLPQPIATTAVTVGEGSKGSILWLVSAVGLSLLGRRGRLGAGGGLVAAGLASALANGPVKWAVRRPRPDGAALAGLRRAGGSPGTSSFPSGHTASAVAFSVAASAEYPLAATVLVPAALCVALARMRSLRHYPSDVLGGAVIGAAIGAGTAYSLRRYLDIADVATRSLNPRGRARDRKHPEPKDASLSVRNDGQPRCRSSTDPLTGTSNRHLDEVGLPVAGVQDSR